MFPKHSITASFLLLSSSLFSLSTFAESGPLVAEMKVYRVEASEKSKVLLTEKDQVKPKQVLEYQVEYQNISTNSLKQVDLTLPIPAYVSFNGNVQPSKDSYASTDGVNFAKFPLTRIEDGKRVNVPFSEYRVLQWKIKEFKPKQKIVVAAQTQVNATP